MTSNREKIEAIWLSFNLNGGTSTFYSDLDIGDYGGANPSPPKYPHAALSLLSGDALLPSCACCERCSSSTMNHAKTLWLNMGSLAFFESKSSQLNTNASNHVGYRLSLL